jgi:LuxR family maltose regulon positive regulatory protein
VAFYVAGIACTVAAPSKIPRASGDKVKDRSPRCGAAVLAEPQAAEASIERALGLAEPDGIVFPFVATPVRELLERHPRHSTSHAALLSDILDLLSGSSLSAPAGQRPELREELSESELRVLRFLPSNLSAPDIGRELYLSLSTVKTHMRHIYAKLGVHRRTEAVDRARELGLLAPSARRR